MTPQEIINGLESMRIQRPKQLEIITAAINLIKESQELKTVLEAWHSIFGTTQLTHAEARLVQAEKEAKKYQELIKEKQEVMSEQELEKIIEHSKLYQGFPGDWLIRWGLKEQLVIALSGRISKAETLQPPEQLPEEIDKTSFLIYDARGEDFRWRVLLDTLNALIRYVGQKDK